jgi:hypothetical protein
MSTRSQTEFIVVSKRGDDERIDKRTIYRHSDGYPGSMVPDLLTFIRWNRGRMDDVEYTAANWIFWNKRRFEDVLLNPEWGSKDRKKIGWTNDCDETLKLGFGVCNNGEYHGDIEYLYRVIYAQGDADHRITIEVYTVEEISFRDPITESNFRLIGRLDVPDNLNHMSDLDIAALSHDFVGTLLPRGD